MRKPLKVALIPGDGIGPEVIASAQSVLEATNLPIDYCWLDAGWETFQRAGTSLPSETLVKLRECDGALFGAVSSPSHRVEGYSSPIIAMRVALDLYANLRPIESTPVPGSRTNVNLLIVRENTEGLYVKQERLEEGGSRAIADRVITQHASERITTMAFEQAKSRQEQRKQRNDTPNDALVTVVHKANVLRVTDGLFRETALNVANGYPSVPVEEQLVDSMVYRLILEPERYDVVVAPNLYGDILSDAAAALVGGLGLIPSANVGDSFVLAEPVHGSAPDIASQGIANPVAAIRAAALLLTNLGYKSEADNIEWAINSTLADGPKTQDLGGTATTDEMTEEIIKRMK
ncbi:MAG: isocitrate/isopropylmalate dehydrogenase family protein [Chloroflexota bacterium]